MHVGVPVGPGSGAVTSTRVEFRQARELWQPSSNTAAPDATAIAIIPSTEYGFQEFFGDQSAPSTAIFGYDKKRKLSDKNGSSDDQAKKALPDNLVKYWSDHADHDDGYRDADSDAIEGTTSQDVVM